MHTPSCQLSEGKNFMCAWTSKIREWRTYVPGVELRGIKTKVFSPKMLFHIFVTPPHTTNQLSELFYKMYFKHLMLNA